MSDVQPPKDQLPPPEESPMGEIDRLLETEDPEFLKFLNEVRAIESDTSVVIDSMEVDEGESLPEERLDDRNISAFAKRKLKFKIWLRGALVSARERLKAALVACIVQSIVFLKTKPKEYFQYALKIGQFAVGAILVPVALFRAASMPQKITALILVVVVGGSLWVLLANFKGIWLPHLNEPILRSLEEHADKVTSFDPKDPGESFYSAFPQERYEFLFPKFKVNLRRTSEHPNPMGAFELIVAFDSDDTAIEVRDREVEFFDLLQRVLEEESFTDLESDLGKNRLKSRIKRELSQELTQGWAKDVSFKTFVLKP